MASRIALPRPTQRASRALPPYAGRMPSVTWGSRHSARSEATSRSQQKVTMQPIPTAYPLTAPTIGLGKSAEDLEGAAATLGDALDEVRGRLHRVRPGILEIRAGRESPTRVVSRQDGAADRVVVLHRREVPRDALVEIGAPRVASLGTTQGDDADRVAPLECDGHDRLLDAGGSSRRAAGARIAPRALEFAASVGGRFPLVNRRAGARPQPTRDYARRRSRGT